MKFWRLKKNGMYLKSLLIINTNDVPSFGAESYDWQIQLIWAYHLWLLLFITWIKAHFTFQINAGFHGLCELRYLGWLSQRELHIIVGLFIMSCKKGFWPDTYCLLLKWCNYLLLLIYLRNKPPRSDDF